MEPDKQQNVDYADLKTGVQAIKYDAASMLV